MGGPQRSSYENLYFPKMGKAIKEHCLQKIENLKKRVERRVQTINDMLKEQNLSTLDVMQLMQGNDEGMFANSATYLSQSNASILEAKKSLKVKDWEAIEGENRRRNEELEEISKLTRVANHIGLEVEYHLSYNDLTYYEFN